MRVASQSLSMSKVLRKLHIVHLLSDLDVKLFADLDFCFSWSRLFFVLKKSFVFTFCKERAWHESVEIQDSLQRRFLSPDLGIEESEVSCWFIHNSVVKSVSDVQIYFITKHYFSLKQIEYIFELISFVVNLFSSSKQHDSYSLTKLEKQLWVDHIRLQLLVNNRNFEEHSHHLFQIVEFWKSIVLSFELHSVENQNDFLQFLNKRVKLSHVFQFLLFLNRDFLW